MVGIRPRQRRLENPRRAHENAPPPRSPPVPAGVGLLGGIVRADRPGRLRLSDVPHVAATAERKHRQSVVPADGICRSEEHTSELQSLMRISYAVFCLKKKTKTKN